MSRHHFKNIKSDQIKGDKISAAEFRELINPTILPKKNKYNAKKTFYNGRTYDSIGEAEYAALLDLRAKAGEIVHIEPQFKIPLYVDGELHTTYRIDFKVVTSDFKIELHEFKGKETDTWLKKWKLAKKQLHKIEPNCTLHLIKKIKGKMVETERHQIST